MIRFKYGQLRNCEMMFTPDDMIEESLILNFDSIMEYERDKNNMIHFLDVIKEDEDGNETVIQESYFSINQKVYRTFEDDPTDVNDFTLIMDDICEKCLDEFGRLRPSKGIVDAYDDTEHSNLNLVPKYRFSIERQSNYAHQYYFVISLPNPAIDYNKYLKFRELMLNYIQTELESFGFYG